MGVGCGEGGCPPMPGRGSGDKAIPPPRFFYFDFGSQIGDFRCILGTIFTVQLFGSNATKHCF